ncbi:pupal cuticle protein 36-like [Zerene cesonia]|uniref:pupal cuticle protein 36-like n=1 Tax=Zerene cesonia TaxID=33412 RepID=UPI0018E567E6|nr:pupal cuticle protein 36-like [Zerene cesonia]
MKLFVIAACIAVASAGRLEHLERSYLPPDSPNSLSGGFNSNSGSQNGFGSGHLGSSTRGSQGFNQDSNGFGHGGSSFNDGFDSQGSNGFGSHGGSNGLAAHTHGTGFNSNQGFGSNGFGSNGALNAADLKQYLPPDQPSSGSIRGFSGSSIKPACSTCGFARQQYSQNQYNSQVPSTQYGQPQFGALSQSGNGFGSAPRSSFEANRQYLAPKAQDIPQQPFDEQTGYHY